MSTTLASSPAASRPTSPARTNSSSNSSSYKLSGRDKNKLQIFLGGSCNPTTWRQNVAIPFLEANGISYYNPQVDNWTPEVVDLERYAKQSAQVLLFVIDKQTRSTTSLIESAFMAGENKSLVLVIYPFEYNIANQLDESKKTSNCFETRNRLLETELTKLNKDDQQADDFSSFIKSSSSSSTSLSNVTSNSPSQFGSNSTTKATNLTSAKTNRTTIKQVAVNCEIDDEATSLKSTHDKARCENSNFEMSGEIIRLDEFLELKQARAILQNLISIKKIPMFSDIHQALKYIKSCLDNNSDRLQTIKDCLENSTQKSLDGSNSENPDEHSTPFLTSTFKQIDHQTSKVYNLKNEPSLIKDVHISLDCDDRISLESTVIPILKEKGLTYNYTSIDDVTKRFNNLEPASSRETTTSTTSDHANLINMPKLSIDSQRISSQSEPTRYSENSDYTFDDTKFAIEKEICAIKSSRVLLFVITNKCRGLSIMVLASHFMALFKDNVVLCIQYLEEPCSIGGKTLTKTAIADYNRGRVYLCDYATKSQVPVFSTIKEAIECCSLKCKYNNES